MLYFLIVAYIGILFLDFIQKHYASFEESYYSMLYVKVYAPGTCFNP